jgi:LmbE family N-acetylglucosaminyl deacetylase
MIKLNFSSRENEPLRVLCIGAHADDIEIGCGGTLLYLAQALPCLRFYWVVLSTPGPRRQEAERAAAMFTGSRDCELVLKDFRDGFFPSSAADLKEFFEETKGHAGPDLIFAPWRGDAHQDHRQVAELTWNTFRNHFILEYEIPKYDGDLGRPNVFVPLESSLYEQKLANLLEAFTSQRSKPWFDREMFLGLMRIRGMESNSPSGYAEAFHCRKLVVSAG